jgi:hypothetical protein
METYSIETDGAGGFQVRATEPAEQKSRIVGGFRTLRQAQEWVDNQIQMVMTKATSSDIT